MMMQVGQLSVTDDYTKYVAKLSLRQHGPIQRGGHGGLTPPPGKSQVAVGILKNTGTDPPREAKGPLGSNCFLMEVCLSFCEIY